MFVQISRWIEGFFLLKLKRSLKLFSLISKDGGNKHGFLDKNGSSEVFLIVCFGVNN